MPYPTQPMTPDELESYVDAAAAATGVSLPADICPGVLTYFGLLHKAAQQVMALDLPMTEEVAPAYSADASHPASNDGN